MTQTVKLAKLKRSEKNVRTTPPKNIEAMAASIRARGIMQNLLVTAARPKGMFEIIAGDRRYLGAMMLAEAGEIVAADYDVPVKIITGDEADLREVSLTENFQREQMTVAEECVAFQHFLKTDGDVDAVAKRFGQTRRFIEGRLRLADLAEPIFEALAAGRSPTRWPRPTARRPTRPSRSACSSSMVTRPTSTPTRSVARSPTTR